MKARWRDTLLYGGLLTVVFVLTMWISSGIGHAEASTEYRSTDLLYVLLIVVWLLGVTSVYLLSLWQSKRLMQLVTQTEEAVFAPQMQEARVAGSDELATLSQLVNQLRLNLTRGEEARNQLVADVAHELRTPLMILSGQIESMQEGALELSREQLVPMLDEIHRLTRLIQDLQQLSLAKSGNLKLHQQWVPFQQMLEEISAVFELEAEDKGVWFVLAGGSDQEVYCDRARIKQVLINLIGNAIRYTGEGGTVEVRLTEEEGVMQVEVVDTGTGIPPESLPYLFQRFYRVEGSRNRQSGGMGLGLAIAKEFVDAHDGTLCVVSELGAGTTFTLRLPVFPLS